VLSLDSLAVVDRLPLRTGVDYIGLFPSPRGLLLVGRDTRPGRRTTWLTEIDTRLMEEVSWFDLPEFATDVAVAGTTAVLPVRRGLYVVDLEFLSVRGVVPLPVDLPGDVALAPDGITAALAMEDPDRPGRPLVGIVDLASGRITSLLR
jgi:hypothetical protein